MSLLETELKRKRDEFGKSLVYSILGILMVFIILNAISHSLGVNYDMKVSQQSLIISSIIISLGSYIISKTNYDFFTLYKLVAFSLFLLVFYFSMLICHFTMAVYFFYLPIIFLILILTNLRVTSICIFSTIIICILTPSISEFLNLYDSTNPNKTTIVKVGLTYVYIDIISSAFLSILMLYYYVVFLKIEINYSIVNYDSPLDNAITSNDTETTLNNKYEQLYKQIINHLNEYKPYQDPEFNKRKLVEILESNETYVSRALSLYGKSFNALINEYKINQIKKEFIDGNYKKFTIEHIYTQAGFTQQSTFNRVFKEYVGVTPSEFIDQIEGSNSK